MKTKLTSRKFWICVAAFLASIAVSISGLHSSNTTVIAIGTICGVISAGIYAACEAWVDKQGICSTEDIEAGNCRPYNPYQEEEEKDGDS